MKAPRALSHMDRGDIVPDVLGRCSGSHFGQLTAFGVLGR